MILNGKGSLTGRGLHGCSLISFLVSNRPILFLFLLNVVVWRSFKFFFCFDFVLKVSRGELHCVL